MGVISVNECHEGRRGWTDAQGAHYTRIFKVVVTSGTSPHTVLTNGSIPAFGSAHPENPLAFCTKVDTGEPEGGTQYTVTVSYDTPSEPRGTLAANPINDPIVVRWSSRLEDWVLEKDLDGDAVLNSAGDPFDPPRMRQVAVTVCSITRNEAADAYDPKVAREYRNSTNSKSITVCGLKIDALEGWLTRYDAELGYRNGYDYWSVTYEIELIHDMEDDWDVHIQDKGWRYLDANGVLRDIQVENKDADEPMLLDGSGHKLATGAAPVYLTFQDKKRKNWQFLDLPTTAPI